jgi:molybdopterin-guanine dinucleotide biosynthesis protein B
MINLIPILAIIGSSGSGKTTFLVKLIKLLTEKGVSVAAAKHMHHRFTVNPQGKDTWKFFKAGATLIGAITPENIVLMKEKQVELSVQNIVNMFQDEKPDLILLEGFHSMVAKNTQIYKIVSAKNLQDLYHTLEGTMDPIIAITGSITKSRTSIPGLTIPFIVAETDITHIIKLIMDIVSERCAN